MNGLNRNPYKSKSKGRIPLGRPRSRWVDNNEMDVREIGWGPVEGCRECSK
jgi:hypothetical protein